MNIALFNQAPQREQEQRSPQMTPLASERRTPPRNEEQDIETESSPDFKKASAQQNLVEEQKFSINLQHADEEEKEEVLDENKDKEEYWIWIITIPIN